MAHMTHDPLDAEMQLCVQNCTDCNNSCVRTMGYCLTTGGAHADAAHLKLLLDCAEACAASVHFMLRGSGLYPQMCGLCAEACQACALSCEQFPGDTLMKACADICRKCAESCREMAGVKA